MLRQGGGGVVNGNLQGGRKGTRDGKEALPKPGVIVARHGVVAREAGERDLVLNHHDVAHVVCCTRQACVVVREWWQTLAATGETQEAHPRSHSDPLWLWGNAPGLTPPAAFVTTTTRTPMAANVRMPVMTSAGGYPS